MRRLGSWVGSKTGAASMGESNPTSTETTSPDEVARAFRTLVEMFAAPARIHKPGVDNHNIP